MATMLQRFYLLSEGQQFGVVVGVRLGLGDAGAFQGLDASGALKDERRHQSLDLGSLCLRLLLSLLQLQRSACEGKIVKHR